MRRVKSVLSASMLALGLVCSLPVLSTAELMEDKAMEDMNVNPAIDGFCPIALHEGALMKGNSEFVAIYKEKKYMFVNAQAKAMFLENPEEYTKDAEMKYQDIIKK